MKSCRTWQRAFQSRKNLLKLTESQKIVREGDRKHMYMVGARKFSKVMQFFSKFMTRCHLNRQSLDKHAINHAFSDGFTIVNFAFILPPLLTQQTRLAFTMVK